jgi:hypothetical protein
VFFTTDLKSPPQMKTYMTILKMALMQYNELGDLSDNKSYDSEEQGGTALSTPSYSKH